MPEPRVPFRRLLLEAFGDEVRRSHSGLNRAERMLDCLSTLAHRFLISIKALLRRHGRRKPQDTQTLAGSCLAAISDRC